MEFGQGPRHVRNGNYMIMDWSVDKVIFRITDDGRDPVPIEDMFAISVVIVPLEDEQSAEDITIQLVMDRNRLLHLGGAMVATAVSEA